MNKSIDVSKKYGPNLCYICGFNKGFYYNEQSDVFCEITCPTDHNEKNNYKDRKDLIDFKTYNHK